MTNFILFILSQFFLNWKTKLETPITPRITLEEQYF